MKQCVDARLNGDYPPKAVAKVMYIYEMVTKYHLEILGMFL